MGLGADARIEMAIERAVWESEIEGRAGRGIWKTLNGDELEIQLMTTKHIWNCINMIERDDGADHFSMYIPMFEKELKKRGELWN